MAGLTTLVSKEQALPGREKALSQGNHAIRDVNLADAYGNINVPTGHELVLFGMGCFWGAEKMFWRDTRAFLTAVGYAGGYTVNPGYEEVCSGLTAHTEVVAVVYDESEVTLGELLSVFWGGHDPTQGMRQGNDIGTQYRSAIYCSSEAQLEQAMRTKRGVEERLSESGYGAVTTEIALDREFYFAEQYHQQYLAKNPNGYCGLGGLSIDLASASKVYD